MTTATALRCAGVTSAHGAALPAAIYVIRTRKASRSVTLCANCARCLENMGMTLEPDRRLVPR